MEMTVGLMRRLLETCTDDAVLIIQCLPHPLTGDSVGEVLHVAALEVDGKDELIVLSNSHADSKGKETFTGEPTFHRITLKRGLTFNEVVATITNQVVNEPARTVADVVGEAVIDNPLQELINGLKNLEAAHG